MLNYSKLAGAVMLGACMMTTMSCKENVKNEGYIGPCEIQLEEGRMTPEVMLALGRLSDPQLSPDGKYILYGVSYTSLAENRSCRNLFVCNVDGSNKRQLSHEGKSVSNARWMPDGKSVAYICGGQIYTAKVQGLNGKSLKLSGKKKLSDVKEGVSEFKFSPDFKSLVYGSTVPSNVMTPSRLDPALDKAQAYITEDLAYRHWDHWVTEIPHTYYSAFDGSTVISKETSIDILGGENVKFELPIEPWSGMEQLTFSPDGRFVAYSCKKKTGKEYAFSTNTEIYIWSVEDGSTVQVTDGGGYDTDPLWSPDGEHLVWLSMARDGYEADKTRLMMADIEDGVTVKGITDLTAGFKYNAAAPLWSSDSNEVYFNSLCEGIQAIFKVNLEGGNPVVERLTGENEWYDFNSPFAEVVNENGVTLLATYCSLNFPNEMVAVNLSEDGSSEIVRLSHENDHILNQLPECRTEKRFVKTVDGKDMLTWVMFPPEFDSTKTYPAIEICLGGPQGTLSQAWSYRWNYRLMASQGYVVVMPNRRGTTAFGQEWTEQISGDYSGLNMQDYLSAARYIKSEPYIGKLAACGASYGGYSVYYLAGVHENTFDCFIAHAGIFDEKYMYYETEEMWFPNWDNGGLEEYAYNRGEMGPKGDGTTFGGMQQAGSPWSNAPKSMKHYANSPDVNVCKWNTPILCIHGCLDFRIPYDQGMAAFNAAQMMGVPSKLVIFPEENHWIMQPQNSVLWHREYFAWLDRWCKE